MDKIQIGRLVNTHGLKGEVKVLSDSDFTTERFQVGNKIFIGEYEVEIKSHRLQKNFHLLTFKEFNNINQVERFKGSTIFAYVSNDEVLDDGEYFYFDLEGLAVMVDAKKIGTIKEVRELPASAMLVLDIDGKQVLYPFVDELIGTVDIEAGYVELKPIEGLL